MKKILCFDLDNVICKTSSNNYIKSLGLGGEKSDNQIIKHLIKFFPNARIINIYASTEAGTLFGSNGTEFHIPEKLRQYVRISKDLELLIHRTLMADVEGLNKTV